MVSTLLTLLQNFLPRNASHHNNLIAETTEKTVSSNSSMDPTIVFLVSFSATIKARRQDQLSDISSCYIQKEADKFHTDVNLA